MKVVRRQWRLIKLAYHLRCAREDARTRSLVTPVGVWVCEHCPHVSLTQLGFSSHLSTAHI